MILHKDVSRLLYNSSLTPTPDTEEIEAIVESDILEWFGQLRFYEGELCVYMENGSG